MINVKNLFKFIEKNKINFFSGVPDSILKNTKDYLERKNKQNHIIAANEGSAVSSCIGYFLATSKIGCAYMQNSGLANAINPLISIAHEKVYSIPLLLLIGWRGAPGDKDEPQHLVKGSITTKILKLLKIKYLILESEKDFKKLGELIKFSRKNNSIVACLIKKNILNSKNNNNKNKLSGISRENFLKSLLTNINNSTNLISTTGYTSRELYQLRKKYYLKKGKDFYMVGGMGHSSMVALGVSLHSSKDTICLDGDGSMIMHMGSIANIGTYAKKNYKHILLNNFSHESVEGQKTFSENLNFEKISSGAGYKKYFYLDKEKNIKKILKKFLICLGPCFLEVKIKQGVMKNLLRPNDLIKIKKNFMKR